MTEWFFVPTLAAAIATSIAAAEGVLPKPKPTSKLKAVEVAASWGPKLGPDGQIKSAVTAVIPKQIQDVILADVKTWYAVEVPATARTLMIEQYKKKLSGRGPSAWFERRVNKDEDDALLISKPQQSTQYELMGGVEQGFETGTWQPPVVVPATRVAGGYRWKLTWMTQLGFGKARRRYRVDVDLTGTADQESGGIMYKAIWKGPFVERPVDFRTIPASQEMKPAAVAQKPNR